MSGIAERPPALNACGSAPHRAVLSLLAIALGRPAPSGLKQDLTQSRPEEIATIANNGHVQTVLHSAFLNSADLGSALPQDLLIYFAEMQRANAARNTAAREQMSQIANILSGHGIPVLALKGAADILDPLHPTPAHRYISDLDLLVPESRAQDAARFIRAAKGLVTDSSALHVGDHHHMAQIVHPDWPLTVELHLRPGSEAVCSVLTASQIFRDSQPSPVSGVRIPSLEDRFLHHILHGMELRHQTAALNLRLLADHICYLRRISDESQKQALTRLNRRGLADWQTDLGALAEALNGIPPEPGSWATQALVNFANPDASRHQDTRFWMRRYVQRLMGPPHQRRQLLRKALSPAAWAEFIQFHRDRRRKFK
ncbi:MAG: hypothetical protein CML60_02845 [Rhodobacteraceae bacterium]|nr:hypothetical protein [Paracoccaceae bacterium]MBT25330.1 hypothetical protein [Paracoccaceae bacterium]